MVERSRIENISQFLEEVDQVAEQIKQVSQTKQGVSPHQLNDLIHVLETCNQLLKTDFLEGKKFSPETMNASIEKALAAIQLFQLKQREAGRKEIEKTIVALFSTLSREINDFDKNLKNLKDYKIGRRVEKTNATKQS